jgi:flagellin-like protein
MILYVKPVLVRADRNWHQAKPAHLLCCGTDPVHLQGEPKVDFDSHSRHAHQQRRSIYSPIAALMTIVFTVIFGSLFVIAGLSCQPADSNPVPCIVKVF